MVEKVDDCDNGERVVVHEEDVEIGRRRKTLSSLNLPNRHRL